MFWTNALGWEISGVWVVFVMFTHKNRGHEVDVPHSCLGGDWIEKANAAIRLAIREPRPEQNVLRFRLAPHLHDIPPHPNWSHQGAAVPGWQVTSHESQVTRDVFFLQPEPLANSWWMFKNAWVAPILWEVLALDAADCRRGVTARTATLWHAPIFSMVAPGCNSMSLVATVADQLLIFAESTCIFTDLWWTGAAADWYCTYTNHRSCMKPFHFFWRTYPDRIAQNLSFWVFELAAS
jgi:hypothetical protein